MSVIEERKDDDSSSSSSSSSSEKLDTCSKPNPVANKVMPIQKKKNQNVEYDAQSKNVLKSIQNVNS